MRDRLASPVVATARAVSLNTSVPLKAKLVLSPDGTRYALGNVESVVVRTIAGDQSWTYAAAPGVSFDGVQFHGNDELWIGKFDHLHDGVNGTVQAWHPSDGSRAAIETIPAGDRWWGTIGSDHVMSTILEEPPHELRLSSATSSRLVEVTGRPIELLSIAPGEHALAYAVPLDDFRSQVVIVGYPSLERITSPPLADVTSVGWLDDDTFVYGTGSASDPTIDAIDLAAPTWAAPREIFHQRNGWLNSFSARHGRILMSIASSLFRGRVITRRPAITDLVDLDPATVNATLGWRSDTSFWAWDALSRQVQTREARRAGEPTAIQFVGDPASATVAGDILIVARRRPTGRIIEAYRADSPTPLWQHPVGASLFVRCAGDRLPPCLVGRPQPDGLVALHAIDPATGTLGAELVPPGRIADAALAVDGHAIVSIAGKGKALRLHGPGGVTALPTEMDYDRSVAFDPRGGYLVAGARARSVYLVQHVGDDGRVTSLMTTTSEVLSLVRPSRTGDQILVVGRAITPELYLVDLPAP